MTDFMLAALAIAGACWYGHTARRAGLFPRRFVVFDYRTCPECEERLPSSQIDIQAHGLRHRTNVSSLRSDWP